MSAKSLLSRPIVRWLAAGLVLSQVSCAGPGVRGNTPEPGAIPQAQLLQPVSEEISVATAAQCSDASAYSAKQLRTLDPMVAPGLYTEHFYSKRFDDRQPIVAGGATYTPYRRFDDDSGLSGTLMLDRATGHALILYKGMNRLLRDSGGIGGMFTDIRAILQAKFGTANDQFAGGERAYREALCDERVQSLEVIGYSLGSQLANYLAVKYGAVGVVFGDMGIDRQVLATLAADGKAVPANQLRHNLTSLSLSGDLLIKMFGVGDRIGDVIELPGGLSGVFHDPEVYAYAANAVLHDREQQRLSNAGQAAQPESGAWETPLEQRLRQR